MSAAGRQTLDQRRAAHAWARVDELDPKLVDGIDRKLGGEYARQAKRLPVRTLTSGLGHALAFLQAKSKDGDANSRLVEDLSDWVLDRRNLPARPADARNLVEAITKGDAVFLQLATDEALAYLQWLTRFAEARFGNEEGDE